MALLVHRCDSGRNPDSLSATGLKGPCAIVLSRLPQPLHPRCRALEIQARLSVRGKASWQESRSFAFRQTLDECFDEIDSVFLIQHRVGRPAAEKIDKRTIAITRRRQISTGMSACHHRNPHKAPSGGGAVPHNR